MFGTADLLKYITTWITMAITIIILLSISEIAYGYLLSRFTKGTEAGIVNPVRSIFSLLLTRILLPSCASKRFALIMPILAIAALLPVCSSISFFTFSPLIDNGGDILQILHFTILSEVFAMIAVYAIGTEYSSRSAGRMVAEFSKLIVVLVAAFASFALYFTALGAHSNPFSLDAFLTSLHLKTLRFSGHAAIAIFVFLALCYSSYCEECESSEILKELPLREYSGLPRALLQIWAAFKAFLIATLITHIFFPWFLFYESESGAFAFWMRLLAFILFWLTVIIVRTFGVMLCHNVRIYLERKLPRAITMLFLFLLIGVAVGIIYYEAYLAAMEAF